MGHTRVRELLVGVKTAPAGHTETGVQLWGFFQWERVEGKTQNNRVKEFADSEEVGGMEWEKGGRETLLCTSHGSTCPRQWKGERRRQRQGGGVHTERDRSKTGCGKVLLVYVSLTKHTFILLFHPTAMTHLEP